MSDQPILKFVCTVKGVVNLGFGVGLLAAPALVMRLYGLTLDPAGQFIGRLLGAAALGLGAVQFFGRNSRPGDLQSLVVGAVTIADLIGFVVVVAAMLSGLMNPLGWSIAALYAFATIGFGLAYLKDCRPS